MVLDAVRAARVLCCLSRGLCTTCQNGRAPPQKCPPETVKGLPETAAEGYVRRLCY